MPRCHFVDVMGGGIGDYLWPINHSSEDESGATLALTRTAPVSGIGFVRQVGDPSPLVRRLKGTILERSQYQKFWDYFFLCMGLGPGPQRSVHFIDQLGSRFEVLITGYNPVYTRTSSNPRGATPDERLVYWNYDLSLEVLNVIENWP